MKAGRAMAAAAALAAAGGAQAQAADEAARFERDYCHDLQRLVQGAPDFVAIYNARPAPPWLGFRPGACRAHEATERLPAAWSCHQHLAPRHLGLDRLVAQTGACLPAARLERDRLGREATFTLPGLRILISEHGGPRAHVGRIVALRVEAVAGQAAPAGE